MHSRYSIAKVYLEISTLLDMRSIKFFFFLIGYVVDVSANVFHPFSSKSAESFVHQPPPKLGMVKLGFFDKNAIPTVRFFYKSDGHVKIGLRDLV